MAAPEEDIKKFIAQVMQEEKDDDDNNGPVITLADIRAVKPVADETSSESEDEKDVFIPGCTYPKLENSGHYNEEVEYGPDGFPITYVVDPDELEDVNDSTDFCDDVESASDNLSNEDEMQSFVDSDDDDDEVHVEVGEGADDDEEEDEDASNSDNEIVELTLNYEYNTTDYDEESDEDRIDDEEEEEELFWCALELFVNQKIAGSAQALQHMTAFEYFNMF